jgi:transposase
MTLADQAAMTTRQDGRVTDEQPSDQPGPTGSPGQPGRARRRSFTKDYKARILAAYDALPEGSSERGALLRAERLYHSHIEHWRKQRDKGALAVPAGKPKRNTGDTAEGEELARLRAENKKLRAEAAKLEARNEKLSGDLDKTRTALDIAGKAFALLQDISSSADSEQS